MVRFARRWIRDEIFTMRQSLKDYNQSHHTSYYINEDIVKTKRKLLGVYKSVFKANKLAGAWLSSESVYVKLLNGKVVTVHTVTELNDLI